VLGGQDADARSIGGLDGRARRVEDAQEVALAARPESSRICLVLG